MDNLGHGVYICRLCGSQDLEFDATAVFNKRTGKFELMNVLDGVYCNKCDHQVTEEWIEPEYLQGEDDGL